MIYSFRNIGKAQITGLQFEVKQTLNKHWKARLGYTVVYERLIRAIKICLVNYWINLVIKWISV
mgnify:CR=1 FL=1